MNKGHGTYLMDEEAPVIRGWVWVGRREGEGKEQEQAHREAIRKGHGAYLMVEEAPMSRGGGGWG